MRPFCESEPSVPAKRDTGPIVRTEWRSGQPRRVVEISRGIVRPGVAHCDWMRYLFIPHDDSVAINSRISPNKLVVCSSNGEAFRWSSIGSFQPAAEVLELN